MASLGHSELIFTIYSEIIPTQVLSPYFISKCIENDIFVLFPGLFVRRCARLRDKTPLSPSPGSIVGLFMKHDWPFMPHTPTFSNTKTSIECRWKEGHKLVGRISSDRIYCLKHYSKAYCIAFYWLRIRVIYETLFGIWYFTHTLEHNESSVWYYWNASNALGSNRLRSTRSW